MAFVDDDERVLGQVIEQRRRRGTGRAAGEMARVVLNPVAVADLADHFEVEHRPLVQPLRLEELPFRFELSAIPLQFLLDGLDGKLAAVARCHEVRLRIDGNLVEPTEHLARERVEPRELVDLIAEESNAQRVLFIRWHDLDNVAADAEGAAPELRVVALVLDLHELAENLVAVDPLSDFERKEHPVVRLG